MWLSYYISTKMIYDRAENKYNMWENEYSKELLPRKFIYQNEKIK